MTEARSTADAELPHELQDDEVQAGVWRYWNSRRGVRRCPCRADLDPIEIPRLLPHIGLIDVIDGGKNFRYRLIGTEMNRVFGHDFTGEHLDDTKSGAYAAFLYDLYSRASAGRSALLSESVFGYLDKRHLTIRRLLLPLAPSDGDPVDMLLFCNTFRMRRPGDPEAPGGTTPADGEPYRTQDIVEIRPRLILQL